MNTDKKLQRKTGFARAARFASPPISIIFLSVFICVHLWFRLSLLAAPPGDVVKAELERHQGVWVATSSIYDGQAAPEQLVRSIKRIVTGDHVVWKRDGESFAGTKIELDPTREPKAIDVIPDGGPYRDRYVLGIYKLEGDKLTICMADPGQPRPKEFKAEKGSRCTLRTFARGRAATPSPHK
jgi:uncharacterized protein (TIGR03067 family)